MKEAAMDTAKEMAAMDMAALEVVVVGAGPIGLAVTREALRRPGLRVRGVVDVDPHKIGMDAGTLTGGDGWGVEVTDKVPDGVRAAIVCTSSSLQRIEPTLMQLLARRIAVVSTCEELVWPWRRQRACAERIDAAAREGGVCVLGTGVNPGFVMDALPLFLSGVCHEVRGVRVERVQDAATRRRPFQDKVGVGMAPAAFAEGMAARRLGHVGLAESCEMLAGCLGFKLDDVTEEWRALVCDAEVQVGERRIGAGSVIGVEQTARGLLGGEACVELLFRASAGEREARDRVVLEGAPSLELVIPGGIPGDVATAALVLNALPALMRAQPGLRTMADMPPLTARAVR